MRTEQEMLDLIIKIAKEDKCIRAAYMHGSRANPNAETDKYSDYDIVYVVNETDSFIQNQNWVNDFGDVIFVLEGLGNQNKFFMRELNDLSRRCIWSMLFKDGNHIDLMIEIKEEAMKSNFIINKPTRILLDKDNCLPEITLFKDEDNYIKKPHEDEYTACCSGFWWFLNNVAKGIVREQLPYAKAQFNSIYSLTLKRMIEWYIGMQTDFSVSAGIDGKYYKKYLPEDIYDLYTKIYSDSEYENFWNAVFSTCELFNKLASGVGDYFGYIYNKQEEKGMTDYLIKVKSGLL